MQDNNFHIALNGNFQRSRRVDSDKLDDGYVVLPTAKHALETMALNIAEGTQRAFTWTGPYGCGKSSFALLLTSLVGDSEARARACALLGENEQILQGFSADKGWTVLRIVGRQGALIEDIGSRLKTRRTTKAVTSKLAQLAKEASPHDGVLIIVDELGKYLEADCASENSYLLQELAEFVCRCEYKIVLVGILHQAMDVYAAKLSMSQRDEWMKVQGRFVDIPLAATTAETLELLSRAIVRKPQAVVPETFTVSVKLTSAWMHKHAGSDEERFRRLLSACWPLNPVTTLMLGPVSRRRFSQNERSIYSFLSSREPLGFMDFINHAKADETYTLARYWDYLRTNFDAAILASGDSHRWLTAIDAVGRAEGVQSGEWLALAKTVAVIDLFHIGTRLQASPEILSAAMGLEREQVIKGLNELVRARVLIERRHINAWAVYAGSDFDLEAAMLEASATVGGTNVAGIADLVKLDPVVARTHYLQSGTMRWFNRRLSAVDELAKIHEEKFPDVGTAGELVLIIPDHEEAIDDPLEYLEDLYQKASLEAPTRGADRMIVVGLPSNAGRIKTLAHDLKVIDEVAKLPVLEGDATGRNEVNIRRNFIRQELTEELVRAFLSADWYFPAFARKVSSQKDLVEYVSALCDKRYNKAPAIINELINRDHISGSIVSARKELLAAMVEKSHLPRMGFEGYPPAFALYLSLLLPFHRKAAGGAACKITEMPDQAYFRYADLWRDTTEMLKRQGKTSVSAVYQMWRKPPYGLKYGPMPILMFAYILGNRRHLAIYDAGVFQSSVDVKVKDDFIVSPWEIELRYIETGKTTDALISSFAAALESFVGADVEETPLGVGRAIVKTVLQMPAWSRRTMKLSPQTLELRSVTLKAEDPVDFVLRAIPGALNTTDPAEAAKALINSLKELQDAAPALFDRLRSHLCNAMQVNADDWQTLNERARKIRGLSGNMAQEAFVTRMTLFKGTDKDIEGLWTLAAGRPLKLSSDSSVGACLSKIDAFAFAFRQQEAFAHLRGREVGRSVFSLVAASGDKDVSRTIEVSSDKRNELKERTATVLDSLKGLNEEDIAAVLASVAVEMLKNKH